MHELAVTESLLHTATDYAQRNQATKVTDLYMVIGQLSSIVDDSVQFYWDIISKDTICEGAKLHFERKPAVIKCLDCNTEYGIKPELTPCPACGSIKAKIISGEEFNLDSIEIERQT
ncbi:MAG TPA: hydrogenase maturation nickel metallochaperone HypA [Longilinea sp.]|nr:hydrogenase maturation nickel metallochaperone HypA [Longilinea sp.]